MSKTHDNNFHLKMVGISNFKFEVSDHYITSGQPWKGVKTSCNQKEAIITVVAGRKKSHETATWFKKEIKNGSAIGCQTTSKLPSELNFAVKGNMSFSHGKHTYLGENIIIAQGSTGFSRNNWWIGGPNMTTLADLPIGTLSIIAQNFKQDKLLSSKVTFTVSAGDVSSMGMNIISIT